jgi:nucleoside-diphosphate-sugar epimerase
MRVTIIGGTGHIGSYLTPMLVEAGHSVTCVCRSLRRPYLDHPSWSSVAYIHLDRIAEEKNGTFGERIAERGVDAVIDLTCYTQQSAEHLVQGLRGRVSHLLHCGTIWVHGHSTVVPTTEDRPRCPFGDYGVRKAAVERYLIEQWENTGFPVTILHPGHLVGPGWAPINPQGNFNTTVFAALMHGEEVRIPNFGMETVHHVHAEDVARAFLMALHHREVALGQSFHVVSASALTLRGYAERMSEYFNQSPRLCFLPWEEWKRGVDPKDAPVTEDHIRHSPNCSIQKARSLLGYEPRHSSLQAVQESVKWLVQNGVVS